MDTAISVYDSAEIYTTIIDCFAVAGTAEAAAGTAEVELAANLTRARNAGPNVCKRDLNPWKCAGLIDEPTVTADQLSANYLSAW